MIEIEEPPVAAACGGCQHPLTHLWSPRRKAWVAFIPAAEEGAIRPHTCRGRFDPPSWRDRLPAPDPSRAHRGAALARAALTKETDQCP